MRRLAGSHRAYILEEEHQIKELTSKDIEDVLMASKSRNWPRTCIKDNELILDMPPNQGCGSGHASKSRN